MRCECDWQLGWVREFAMIALCIGRMFFNVLPPFIFSLSICKRWCFWVSYKKWEIVSGFQKKKKALLILLFEFSTALFPRSIRAAKMSLLGPHQERQVRLRWLSSLLENPDCLSIAFEDFFYNTARAVDYKTHFRARAQGAEVSKTCWPAIVINCVSRGSSSLSVQCCRGLSHLFFGRRYVGTATWTLNVICGGGQLWTTLNFCLNLAVTVLEKSGRSSHGSTVKYISVVKLNQYT